MYPAVFCIAVSLLSNKTQSIMETACSLCPNVFKNRETYHKLNNWETDQHVGHKRLLRQNVINVFTHQQLHFCVFLFTLGLTAEHSFLESTLICCTTRARKTSGLSKPLFVVFFLRELLRTTCSLRGGETGRLWWGRDMYTCMSRAHSKTVSNKAD